MYWYVLEGYVKGRRSKTPKFLWCRRRMNSPLRNIEGGRPERWYWPCVLSVLAWQVWLEESYLRRQGRLDLSWVLLWQPLASSWLVLRDWLSFSAVRGWTSTWLPTYFPRDRHRQDLRLSPARVSRQWQWGCSWRDIRECPCWAAHAGNYSTSNLIYSLSL